LTNTECPASTNRYQPFCLTLFQTELPTIGSQAFPVVAC